MYVTLSPARVRSVRQQAYRSQARFGMRFPRFSRPSISPRLTDPLKNVGEWLRDHKLVTALSALALLSVGGVMSLPSKPQPTKPAVTRSAPKAATPEPTLEASPSPVAVAESPTPEPSATPTSTSSPSPSPMPTASPSPLPSATVSPSPVASPAARVFPVPTPLPPDTPRRNLIPLVDANAQASGAALTITGSYTMSNVSPGMACVLKTSTQETYLVLCNQLYNYVGLSAADRDTEYNYIEGLRKHPLDSLTLRVHNINCDTAQLQALIQQRGLPTNTKVVVMAAPN